ncbi:MAG: NADH-quinone oxidoreductase subunit C/D [Deltaproteobacteria bacterium]
MNNSTDIVESDIYRELQHKFERGILMAQSCRDEMPTVWVSRDQIHAVLNYLKHEAPEPFRMLYDLTAVDERTRIHRQDLPQSDFSVVYQLLSFDRNLMVRVKVPLEGEYPSLNTITDIWPSANWYEREVWDMFGITFEGHPHLRRILLPPTWEGHPLRKEHPARATEMGPFHMPEDRQAREEEAMRFRPEEWGLQDRGEETDLMFLNLGPQHPGAHGVFRIVLQLDGEEIVDAVPEIGFHHRGAEKMGERQTWHTFIPYTDRIDYLGGVMNNLPYVLAVEKLAGIQVPDRVKVIRIMMVELFRIISHLVWYGTFAQDVGMLSPVFFMFNDRERAFGIVSAVTGGRMHPSWFRIGGVAQDLPRGWNKLFEDFLLHMSSRLIEYDKMVMQNRIFKERTQGIGSYTLDEATDWGVTGPGLRACGLEWDFRKKMPYCGYEQFEFEIPTAVHGDCYDRALVRVEEMRQSLRIIGQCLKNMPAGPYKAHHPLTTPPLRDGTLHDIETLINHFLGVSWGPVIPAGEAHAIVEATKGNNSYYLISDGGIHAYRVRIRTPSFAHLQMIPVICRGLMVPDLLAILGNIDYVMADVDR